MRTFAYPEGVYNALPRRIVFGAGSINRLGEEIDRLDRRRVVIVCTPGRLAFARTLGEQIGGRCVGFFADARTQVPIEIAEQARSVVRELTGDCVVTIGGGASVGFGKAIALETPVSFIAIPTTYSGSEMTGFCGITIDGVKRMHASPRMLADTVIYDPELTLGLPPEVSGPSGMNAVAHCVEALYARTAGPIPRLMAVEGIRTMSRALPKVVAAPQDLEARTEALYGAYLGGGALTGGFAIQHGLAHVLGGTFGILHGDAHTVTLPHAVRFNAPAAPEAMAAIADALGTDDAATGLFDLAARIGAPTSLEALGMREADLDRAAAIAVETAHDNPRAVDHAGMRAVLDDMFHGRRPQPFNPASAA